MKLKSSIIYCFACVFCVCNWNCSRKLLKLRKTISMKCKLCLGKYSTNLIHISNKNKRNIYLLSTLKFTLSTKLYYPPCTFCSTYLRSHSPARSLTNTLPKIIFLPWWKAIKYYRPSNFVEMVRISFTYETVCVCILVLLITLQVKIILQANDNNTRFSELLCVVAFQ